MTGAMFDPLTDDDRANAPETDTAREAEAALAVLGVKP